MRGAKVYYGCLSQMHSGRGAFQYLYKGRFIRVIIYKGCFIICTPNQAKLDELVWVLKPDFYLGGNL